MIVLHPVLAMQTIGQYCKTSTYSQWQCLKFSLSTIPVHGSYGIVKVKQRRKQFEMLKLMTESES